MPAKIVDLAAYVAAKKAGGASGSSALAKVVETKKKAPKKKARRKAGKARIKASRPAPVRVTSCPDKEYRRLVGHLTLDRVDGEVVRATFDPAFDRADSFDMDCDGFEYDEESKVYRMRDVDDGKPWAFARMVKL